MKFRLLLLVLGLTAPVVAATRPAVRIAVVSDASEKDLAALVTTELSSSPSVTLLERDDLARIGDEAKVQQMAGSDATALGRLAGADGLVFLDQHPGGAHVRFTAVNLGYALFEDPIPMSIDAAQEARAIAHVVVADAAKLKLDPARAIPISVLNLRANTASADSATLERALTALLESRLASVPEYVVLERRHGYALGFERSLATPDPLLKGAYLIDGSITLPASGAGDLHVSLRLRSPKGGKETALDFKGTTADLPGLVQAMGESIGPAVGVATSPPQWQPASEAREYLQEGIWGWEHHDPRAALEALDSAALLGETASDLLAIRVQVLCLLAGQEPYFYGGKYLAPEPLSLEQRLGLIRRALVDLRAYQHDGEKNLQLFNTSRDVEVRAGEMQGEVLKAGLAILHLLDLESPETDALRQDLREVANFDPLHGKTPEFLGWEPNDLSNSLDEELAYYRILATEPRNWLPGVGPVQFCERFLKTPEEQRAAYDRFAQGLLTDPKGRLFGLLLLTFDADAATRDAAYTQFLAELWTRREDLAKAEMLRPYFSPAANLPEDLRRKHMKQAIPMLHFCLTQSEPAPTQLFRFLWLPSSFPVEDAPTIWREFQGWKAQRMAKIKGLQEQGVDVEASLYEQQFLAVFPESGGRCRRKGTAAAHGG
jgi:curli biogenesis system outer membrane secretion channel CsgG